MDGQRFDELTRRLAGGTSRRGVLRGAAGALAAALGLRARGTGAQQRKRPLCHATGDPKRPWVVIDVAEPAWETHFAHGDTAFANCCAEADCPAGHACCATAAGGTCADLTTTADCGACGAACTAAPANATPACSDGQCAFVCNQGYARCGDACVNTGTDVDNCGGCGVRCPVNEHCEAGRCVCGTLRDAGGTPISCYELHPDWPQPGTYCCPLSKVSTNPDGSPRSECLRVCNLAGNDVDYIDLGPGNVAYDCGGTPVCRDGAVPCQAPYDPTQTCPGHAVCCHPGTACDPATGACVRL